MTTPDSLRCAEARRAVAATAARLVELGLVTGTAGNVSVRVGDLVAITPSGLDYAALRPETVGLHALDGAPVEAPLAPSSELPLHLAVYARTDAGAVVHTHGAAATAVSLLLDRVPPVHYYAALFGGPIEVAPYYPFGSAPLAEAAADALTRSRGVVLAHHGAVTIGADHEEALELAATLDWLCEVYLKAAAAGQPAVLSDQDLTRAGVALRAYRAARP